jgi:hypothetical protein
MIPRHKTAISERLEWGQNAKCLSHSVATASPLEADKDWQNLERPLGPIADISVTPFLEGELNRPRWMQDRRAIDAIKESPQTASANTFAARLSAAKMKERQWFNGAPRRIKLLTGMLLRLH